jgi:hypothetical protein
MSHRSRCPDRAVENAVFAGAEPVTEKSGEKNRPGARPGMYAATSFLAGSSAPPSR